MDNYIEFANQYLLRKESKKRNIFKEIFGDDYGKNMKWDDKK